MNTFRRIMFFFLAIFVLVGAHQVSALFAVTDASFAPANLTAGVGFPDRTISIIFNITNVTGWHGSGTAGDPYYDNISNITVQAIDSNGQLIFLGANTTGPGNGGVLLAEEIATKGTGDYTYVVEVLITYNSSLLNESNVPATGSITLNVSFEMWNLTGNGEFNQSIDNAGHSILFDVFGPRVSIKFLDTNNNEKTKFGATDKVKIVCTRSSALSNFNDTNLSIMVPAGSQFDSLESSSTRASAATDFTVEFSQTRELGDYTAACFSVDDNSLLNDTVNSTFTIIKKAPSGSSPFVNPDFKPPVATILVTAGSVSALGALTEEGSSRLIMKGGAVSVTVQETDYTLTLKELTDTSATYTLDGATPFDVTLAAKESKNVDVTGDGSDDLTIVLHQVYNKRADTTFKLLSVQGAGPSTEPPTNEGTQEPATPSATSSGSSTWGIVVVIFLIILAVLGGLHYFSARKRGGSNGTTGSLRFNARDMGMQRPPNEPRTLTRN